MSNPPMGICPVHGPVQGFLSAPVYAGEPRDPRGTGQRWCSACGLLLSPMDQSPMDQVVESIPEQRLPGS